jgi:hypothetical protein
VQTGRPACFKTRSEGGLWLLCPTHKALHVWLSCHGLIYVSSDPAVVPACKRLLVSQPGCLQTNIGFKLLLLFFFAVLGIEFRQALYKPMKYFFHEYFFLGGAGV